MYIWICRGAACSIASQTLRNADERPSHHPEALEPSVGVPRAASRAPAPLLEAQLDLMDRKSPHSTLIFDDQFYIGNHLENRSWEKVAGLWTVTRIRPPF